MICVDRLAMECQEKILAEIEKRGDSHTMSKKETLLRAAYAELIEGYEEDLAGSHYGDKEIPPPPSSEEVKSSKQVNKSASPVLDIEDMGNAFKKSLVPSTMKQLKESGIKPYTYEDRVERIAELNTLTYPNFAAKLRKDKIPLKRMSAVVFQANIGLHCNQACTHCHVDSSPSRKEMMTRETTNRCLDIIRNSPSIKIIDLTGGAPELNREFRYWVTECRALGLEVIDRCNLTVLLEPTQKDLGAFLAENKVHVIASLPCYLEDNVDTQRGNEVFKRSIAGLKILNALGYGTRDERGLKLDLVYNPTGVHLPPAQAKLELAYKKHLAENFDIVFDSLHCITNQPINRFHDHLKDIGKLETYMDILVDNFNPKACEGLMCKNYVSVRWDGNIYDCDFNQQVELNPKSKDEKAVSVFNIECTGDLLSVPIATSLHCYACTAGAGSS